MPLVGRKPPTKGKPYQRQRAHTGQVPTLSKPLEVRPARTSKRETRALMAALKRAQSQ